MNQWPHSLELVLNRIPKHKVSDEAQAHRQRVQKSSKPQNHICNKRREKRRIKFSNSVFGWLRINYRVLELVEDKAVGSHHKGCDSMNNGYKFVLRIQDVFFCLNFCLGL